MQSLLDQLKGLDALLSTVQMPTGIPVATVAVDGAANAALLAVAILALGNPENVGSDKSPLREALRSGVSSSSLLKTGDGRFYQLHAATWSLRCAT